MVYIKECYQPMDGLMGKEEYMAFWLVVGNQCKYISGIPLYHFLEVQQTLISFIIFVGYILLARC